VRVVVCGGVNPETPCTPPARLRIPHKLWAYGDRLRDFVENWLAVSRWASTVNSEAKCQFHPPRQTATPESDRVNYNALRRWVDSACLCCAASAKHELPVPGLYWSHAHYMKTVERWVDLVIETCGS
jgi:hypothetical protein